jgi:hypothetical protein
VIPLDPGELLALRVLDGIPRTTLKILVAGRAVSVDVAAKAVRKAQTTIREAGVESSVALVQGRLDLATMAVVEAGLVAQVRGGDGR